MKRPLILISNDDGYKAKGINFLIEVLAPIADILVMAPTNGRSGMGCAITSKDPVYYSLVEEEQGITIFKCTGTPVDCIKLALHEFPERTPDIIIGGVNHGDNSGINVHYSGTMGIVIEGCMKGIPSIGFSLDNHSPEADFEPLRPYILQVVNQVLEHSLPIGTCLNVNFPATPIYEGIKICRMAQGEWTQEWERHSHPRGGDYYWLVGSFCMRDEHPEDADRTNMTDGYVAITPIHIDMTDYRMIEEMKAEWSWES